MSELTELCNDITETLSHAVGLAYAEAYDELTSPPPADDCPLLQVRAEGGVADRYSRTDRTSFHGKTQQEGVTIYIDLYASRRNVLADDMAITLEMVDAVRAILKDQEDPPFFGNSALISFTWRWQRRVFSSGPKVRYSGARFTLECSIK